MIVPLRAIVWSLNVLLLGAVAYSAAVTCTMLLERYLTVNTPPPQPRQVQQDGEAPRRRLPVTAFDEVLQANIFGARRSETPPQAVARSSAQQEGDGGRAAAVELDVRLTGVVLAGRQRFAFVVGPDGRTERIYRPGECLPEDSDERVTECRPDQGKLARVEPRRIVVTVGSSERTFALESVERPQSAGRGASNGARRSALRSQQPEAPATTAQGFESSRSGNTIEYRVPNAEVEQAFENFAQLLKQARVVPFNRDGEMVGFQIRRIQAGSLFERLGLHNFDVIRQVNGEAITNADQALRLFNAFRNEREIVVDIERRNQPLQLSYYIE